MFLFQKEYGLGKWVAYGNALSENTLVEDYS